MENEDGEADGGELWANPELTWAHHSGLPAWSWDTQTVGTGLMSWLDHVRAWRPGRWAAVGTRGMEEARLVLHTHVLAYRAWKRRQFAAWAIALMCSSEVQGQVEVGEVLNGDLWRAQSPRFPTSREIAVSHGACNVGPWHRSGWHPDRPFSVEFTIYAHVTMTGHRTGLPPCCYPRLVRALACQSCHALAANEAITVFHFRLDVDKLISNREHDDANPGLSKGQRLVLHILRMAYAGSSVTRVPSDQMRQRWDLYRHWDLYEQRHY